MKSTRLLGAVGAAAISLGTLASAAPAAAEPSPAGCTKGYVCGYSGTHQRGWPALKARGNWSGRVAVRSIFNNGQRQPGADHVQLEWLYRGKKWSACLHYNPGPGLYKLNFKPGVWITRSTWRGECEARGSKLPRSSGARH
jgi:hypothetical protein